MLLLLPSGPGAAAQVEYRPRQLDYRPRDWSSGPLQAPGLGPAERARLQRDGLVARLVPHGLFETTRRGAAAGRPVLITADLVAELVWLEFGAMVQRLERNVLAPRLAALARRLVAALDQPAPAPRDLQDGLALARAYAEVLERLGQTGMAAATSELARRELLRIEAGRRARSPLLGRVVDYGRFAGRGPYRRQLLWIGQPLGRPDLAPAEAPRFDARLVAGLLICRVVQTDRRAREAWTGFRQALALLVGGRSAGDAQGFLAAARLVYGDALAPERLAEAERWDEFAAELSRLRGAGGRAGLVLAGRRRSPDFALLAGLAWPNVGTSSVRRIDPGGLDLAAALGSTRAAGLLLQRHALVPGFRRSLHEARKRHLPLPPGLAGRRVRTLYDAGLHAVRALLLEPPHGGPLPRWRGAWRERVLSSALGLWLRLRHAPRSPAALAAARPQHLALEPAPELYVRLAASVRWFEARLAAAGAPPAVRSALSPLADELDWLVDHATRAVAGRRPSRADESRLAGIWLRWLARPVHPPAGERIDERLFLAYDEQRTQEVRGGMQGCLALRVAWPAGARRQVYHGAAYAYREGLRAGGEAGALPLAWWLRGLILERENKR